jgi:hypothetical protein
MQFLLAHAPYIHTVPLELHAAQKIPTQTTTAVDFRVAPVNSEFWSASPPAQPRSAGTRQVAAVDRRAACVTRRG